MKVKLLRRLYWLALGPCEVFNPRSGRMVARVKGEWLARLVTSGPAGLDYERMIPD